MPVIKSPQADQDLDAITLSIARRSSVDVALGWMAKLDAFFDRIATAPGMGTSREQFVPGLRSVPFGEYLIFFRKRGSRLVIMRVIHGARRWRKVLREHLD